MEWISVKDRLPEVILYEGGKSWNCVLVYGKDNFDCGSDIQVVSVPWLLGKGSMDGITHWMPLPEPPKES
jgi:hypothetical protein